MDHPVQKGIRPHEIMQALGMIEENFLNSVKKKKGNPEKEHLRVLGAGVDGVRAEDAAVVGGCCASPQSIVND